MESGNEDIATMNTQQEIRAALQALVTAVEANPPESTIDPGCYQCSEEMDAGEKAYMCSYHAAYYSAKALLARPEPPSITLNAQGEAFIPGISEEDEAIVNAILKRRAVNDRIKRPEPEPRITREAPNPISEWDHEDGPVLWWKFPIEEPPYVGTPGDERWEEHEYDGYYTHWTRIPIPSPPAASDGEKS